MGRAKIHNTKLPTGITMFRDRYRVRITYEGVQYDVGSWPNLALAKAALQTALMQKATGTFVPPPIRRKLAQQRRQEQKANAVTLNEWVMQWLEQLEAKGRTESTLVSYRSIMNAHVLPVLGEKQLNEITTEQIRALVDQIRLRPSKQNPNARKGVNGVAPNVVRTLRSCFNDAIERGVGGLTESPVKVEMETKKVRADEELGEVATPAEVWAFYDEMPDHLKLAVLLAGFIGLRLGEVLGLERRDFEGLETPDQAWINIDRQVNSKARGAALTEPKAGSKRKNSIPQALVLYIQAHLNEYVSLAGTSALFPSARTANGRISQTSFDNAWRSAREAVGRPTFRFHALRATALTLFARTGATNADILRRGGHKSLDVAQRYQHGEQQREQQLTAELNSFIRR